MSPQEKICVDKCHQKNDLTFWPVNFRFHYGKNNMHVSCSGLSTSVHWFWVSLCQVADLLKRTTTFHRFHMKSRRPHYNIWSQHTPTFMYRLFCLWKQCGRMFFNAETQWEGLWKSTSGALLPLIVQKCAACHFNRWQAWASHVITENDHMAVYQVHNSVLFDIGLFHLVHSVLYQY